MEGSASGHQARDSGQEGYPSGSLVSFREESRYSWWPQYSKNQTQWLYARDTVVLCYKEDKPWWPEPSTSLSIASHSPRVPQPTPPHQPKHVSGNLLFLSHISTAPRPPLSPKQCSSNTHMHTHLLLCKVAHKTTTNLSRDLNFPSPTPFLCSSCSNPHCKSFTRVYSQVLHSQFLFTATPIQLSLLEATETRLWPSPMTSTLFEDYPAKTHSQRWLHSGLGNSWPCLSIQWLGFQKVLLTFSYFMNCFSSSCKLLEARCPLLCHRYTHSRGDLI